MESDEESKVNWGEDPGSGVGGGCHWEERGWICRGGYTEGGNKNVSKGEATKMGWEGGEGSGERVEERVDLKWPT